MSIRRRLTLTLAGTMLLLVSASGLALYGYVRVALTRQFDAVLSAKAQALHSLLRVGPSSAIEFDFSDDAMPEFDRSHAPEYFQLCKANGENVERSNSLGKENLAFERTDAPLTHRDMRLPDGRSGRAVVMKIGPNVEEDASPQQARQGGAITQKDARPSYFLTVARTRSDLDGTLTTLALTGSAGGIIVALAVGILIPWLVSRSLTPLHAIANRATEIDATALDVRFVTEGMPAELRPICARLNDLLGRLQAAFIRERRFSADVAHELRTPIAELRLLSELALKFQPDNAAVKRSFQDALGIARQMGQIVETLLMMIADDAAKASPELEATNATAIIERAWLAVTSDATSKNIRFTLGGEKDIAAASNAILLAQIIRNLLANAVEYSPPGALIECTQAREKESLLITISNPASSLDEADLPHLAEPFWRKDASRTSHHHAGLGLALVVCYAAQIKAQVNWKIIAKKFSVTLRLPVV